MISRVQPFLRKIFEGVSALDFDAGGAAVAMRSAEGEAVPFSKCALLQGIRVGGFGCQRMWGFAVRLSLPTPSHRTIAACPPLVPTTHQRRRPFSPASAGGAVERWLLDCEAAMRDTLRRALLHPVGAMLAVKVPPGADV